SNFPTFRILIEEHASGKGLLGYVKGMITEPSPPSGTTTPVATAVYSTVPSLEEWTYRDGVAKSLIVTNILDPIGLGVKRDGTAKECWD
ncbi:hypothetical protein B0H17DRAFT_873497, partial [Mycena rosella]